MVKRKLFKYEKEARKKERHKHSKAYANKIAKKDYRDRLKKWKLDVKIRDNYTCQICKLDAKDMPHNSQAHHILDKKNFKELSTDIMNGITLCYRDHKVGKCSPHMNALFFANWLRKNKPKQYEYLMNKLKINKFIKNVNN